MPDEEASARLSDTLLRMSAVLFAEQTLEDILDLVVSLAVEALSADEASITLRRTSTEETTNGTSDGVFELDWVQYESGRGPCLRAARTGETIETALEPGDERWPEYAAAAAEAGFRRSLSVPLFLGTEPQGSLNVYTRALDFEDRDRRAAQLFGQQASIVLANAIAFTHAELLNLQLQEALATREMIGQAKGMIMARQGIGPDEAFDVLRRMSQRSNRKLREIAQDVVETATRQTEA